MIIISTQKIHRLENKETVTTPTETADDDDTFSHVNYPFVMHTYTICNVPKAHKAVFL